MSNGHNTYKDQIVILFGWQRKRWLTKREIFRTVGCAKSTVGAAFAALRRAGRQVNMRWNRNSGAGRLGAWEYNLQRKQD